MQDLTPSKFALGAISTGQCANASASGSDNDRKSRLPWPAAHRHSLESANDPRNRVPTREARRVPNSAAVGRSG